MQIIFKFSARSTNYTKEYHVKNFDYCLVDRSGVAKDYEQVSL